MRVDNLLKVEKGNCGQDTIEIYISYGFEDI